MPATCKSTSPVHFFAYARLTLHGQAARYENDPQVAIGYIEQARLEAEGARDELGSIATALGVSLTKSKRTVAQDPAEAIRFEPRPTGRN